MQVARCRELAHRLFRDEVRGAELIESIRHGEQLKLFIAPDKQETKKRRLRKEIKP